MVIKPFIKNKLRLFAGILVLIFIYKTDFSSQFAKISSALCPVTAAAVFAWFLVPLKTKLEIFFEKSLKNRFKTNFGVLSAFFVYALFLTSTAIFIMYLIPIIRDGISCAITKAPDYLDFASKYLNIDSLGEITKKINPSLYVTGAKITFSFAVNVLTSLVLLIYILLEHKKLKAFAVRLLETAIGEEIGERAIYYFTKVNLIFQSYFYGKAVSSLILGAITTAGFLIIRTGNPVFFGITVAVSNIIPIFGAIVCTAAIALSVLAEHGAKKMLAAVIVILICQQIENNILTPKIIGTAIGLSGFWTLFSLTVGGGVFGFWGLLAAIPTAAAIKAVRSDFEANPKTHTHNRHHFK